MPRFPVRWRRSLPVPLEPGDCKEYLRLDRPENTTKSRRRRRERMPPSVAVSFVEEGTRDGLSERETMLLSKFEHAAHRFLPLRLAGCGWRCLDGRFLSERKEVRFQRHATGVSARQQTCFNLGPQVDRKSTRLNSSHLGIS